MARPQDRPRRARLLGDSHDVRLGTDADGKRERYVVAPGRNVVVMDRETDRVDAADGHDLVIGRVAGIEWAGPDNGPGAVFPGAAHIAVVGC